VERKDKKSGLLKGFSENYIPVQFSGLASLAGQIVPVRLIELRGKAAWGETAGQPQSERPDKTVASAFWLCYTE
jgi:hypothetical protein